jgi:hypothetical protein
MCSKIKIEKLPLLKKKEKNAFFLVWLICEGWGRPELSYMGLAQMFWGVWGC